MPEQRARQNIDRMLELAGWNVQDMDTLDLSAARGVAIREFPLQYSFADYMLFVDGQAVGVIEAKKEGTPLSGVDTSHRSTWHAYPQASRPGISPPSSC
jgi:type I restriction enzyme R subunit